MGTSTIQNEVLWAKVLYFFGPRARTTQELNRFLTKLKNIYSITPEQDAFVQQKVTEEHLIEDTQFAKDWIASKLRTRQTGQAQLHAQLRQRGVSEEHIQQALHAVPEEDLVAGAVAFARKKEGKWIALPKKEQVFALKKILFSRGFSGSIIAKAIDALTQVQYNSE